MRHPRTTLLAGLVLALALLAVGCGSGDEEVAATGDTSSDTTSPDTPVSDVTGQSLPGTSDPTGVSWTRIEPTDDLIGAVVVTPTELVVDPDDDTVLLVRFYGGVQDCYGANVALVREDDSVVEVRLETGSRPEAADRACIEIAEAQELAVALDAPLGDRRVTASDAG